MRGCGLASMLLIVGLSFAAAAADELPEGEGRELVEKRCSTCHGLDDILNSRGRSRERWETVVYDMSAIARRKPEVLNAIVDYLAEHFPPETP